jgi:hypothetical protein
VGSSTCSGCHADINETFMASGHAWIMNPVAGEAPDYPFSQVPEPPEGYTWEDISYVVGGYNWKARFLDQEGYIVTGPPGEAGSADYLNQYNLANDGLNTDADWVSFHAGEAELAYECGACHTTGYANWPPGGTPEDLPGAVGIWALPGVQCEACHGPGSLHAANPPAVDMEIVRDSALCQDCHLMGRAETLDVAEGFIQHEDTYGDLSQGKHEVLTCVTCHDPHAGVKQLREAGEPTVRAQCETCHFGSAQNQAVEVHQRMGLTCIQCHMPQPIQNAWGNADIYLGDVRTHRVVINPTQLEQFTEDGAALPQIGLNFACRHCHGGTMATPKTDEELLDAALGYHEPPEPTAVPEEAVEETTEETPEETPES